MDIINKFDKTIIDFAHSMHNSNESLDFFFSSITHLGDLSTLLAIVIIFILIKKTRVCGINMFISLIISFIITAVILKPLIARERPFIAEDIYYDYWVSVGKHLETTFSFPSTHATVSFATYFPIFLHFSKKYTFIAVIIALLISFSRVYLIVHYPSDVFAGMLIGITVSYITYIILKKYKIKFINN